MGVNKVIYYGEVLVDMSQVTVTPDTLGKGATALDAKGDLITGQHECKKTDPKLQTKTVTPTTAQQTVNPDSGYDGLSKVTVNAMPTATQATPSITVSSSGLITAKSTQSAGYVAAGTKQATKQLTTQAAKTVTPSTSDQTAVASGRYTTGAITVKGDANLKAENIAEGVSIFGVTGTHSSGSGGGGSGGGAVETCSVTIKTDGVALYQYVASTYNDGHGDVAFGGGSHYDIPTPLAINNVICGTAIYVNFNAVMMACRIEGGAQVVSTFPYAIKITGDCTITLYDDD